MVAVVCLFVCVCLCVCVCVCVYVCVGVADAPAPSVYGPGSKLRRYNTVLLAGRGFETYYRLLQLMIFLINDIGHANSLFL